MGSGRRLTGKASPYIGEVLNAAFNGAQAVVVVLSGDDEARLRDALHGDDEPAHETTLTPQARPNVLFEAGMAMGRDADRTILIEFGKLRPFTDVAGRHTLRMTGSPAERQALVERLRTAGCDVNTTGTDWLTRNYFETAVADTSYNAVRVAAASASPAANFVPVEYPERSGIGRKTGGRRLGARSGRSRTKSNSCAWKDGRRL